MRQVMRDDPMKDLKVLLHCEEYTDVDAVIVEAIDEIEELREQVNITPTERERRFIARLNDRDEAHSQFMAQWLDNRSLEDRTAIASERILQVAIRAFEAAMCNYASATDGHGRTVEMHEVIYAVVRAVEDKVHSITKGGDK